MILSVNPIYNQGLLWSFFITYNQGSGNFEIWIGPADDVDVINEPIFKKINMYISPVTKTNDNWQSCNSF